MALQFQPPNIPIQPSKAQSLLSPVNDAIQTLPMLWLQYQNQKKQHELQSMELDLKKRQIESQYGTGVAENIQPGQLTSAPSPNAGPEEQMFGFDATSPTFTQETPEQQQRRVGTERYGQLHPPQYGSYIMGPDGKPQLIQFPQGVKPGPAIQGPTPILDSSGKQVGQTIGKPTVLAKNEEDKNSAKLMAEKPKALGSLQNTLREYDNMIAGAQAIKDDPALDQSTGLFAGKMNVSSGQRRIAANLDTLKAKTLLNVLGSLKDLSKNGSSGFGQLSELEGENIRNSISSLSRSQSTPDFQASIDRFINEMQSRKQTLQDTFSQTYGEAPKQDSGGGLPSLGDMFQGHKVLSVKRVK